MSKMSKITNAKLVVCLYYKIKYDFRSDKLMYFQFHYYFVSCRDLVGTYSKYLSIAYLHLNSL